MRRFFLENALFWAADYHIDALRLDALHAIVDLSPQPFVAELAETVRRARERRGRKFYLMAESDLNDVRLIRTPESGGYGLDAHWNDDFHHALHTLLTAEQAGYYQDFGSLEQLAQGWREGFIYSGESVLSGTIFAHKASLTRILPSILDASALREKEAHIKKASGHGRACISGSLPLDGGGVGWGW
ncbi:MAG: hypothetical protein FJ128_02235 [Deltaproteobacteria bacterium]|nr:hypothetical protein [Deltaproteobacteria bacterium]